MARRLGWFVGLAGLLLVLARLGRVLEPAVDTPDWRLIVPVAAVGGILVTWATSRLGLVKRAAAHVIAISLVLLRVTAPETLQFGVLPGADTMPVLGERLAYAFEILRFGAPPVLAVAGLAALAAAALWCLGAVWAWSVNQGEAWPGILSPLAFYLYLAVVDRGPSAMTWNLAFAAVAALGLVATSTVVPAGAGHLRSRDHRPLPRWQVGPGARLAFIAAFVGLVGVTVLGTVVPAGGTMDWRTPGGEGTGSGSGGFAASRFVGLRQSILSLSDDPVFLASVDPAPPPGTAGYWRLLTLDRYTGEDWVTGQGEFGEVAPGMVESPASSTTGVIQTIQIESLSDDRLPSLYVPEVLASSDPVIRSGASLGDDGNLLLNALTFGGLTYRVESQVPQLDLGALASEGGELTPMFAEAAATGELSVAPSEAAFPPRPAEINSYLSLPETIDTTIGNLAREVTASASTPFESALLIEDYLQEFDYSANVSTGHSSLDLAAWLTDPDSPNFQTGYCEQFAAAMAVMGRFVSLPTRIVIGFTRGEEVDTADGPLTVVRERNAHAWVEVWLDGQGWVGFDPTPRSDGATVPMADTLGFDPGSFDLASSGVEGINPGAPDIFANPGDIPIDVREAAGSTGSSRPLLRWLAGLLIVGLAASSLPAIKATRTSRRRQRARSGDVEAAWREITDRLADLGGGPRGHETPIEFAQYTARELLPLARAYSAAIYGGRSFEDALAHLEEAEHWIDRAYERPERTKAMFSARSLLRR